MVLTLYVRRPPIFLSIASRPPRPIDHISPGSSFHIAPINPERPYTRRICISYGEIVRVFKMVGQVDWSVEAAISGTEVFDCGTGATETGGQIGGEGDLQKGFAYGEGGIETHCRGGWNGP